MLCCLSYDILNGVVAPVEAYLWEERSALAAFHALWPCPAQLLLTHCWPDCCRSDVSDGCLKNGDQASCKGAALIAWHSAGAWILLLRSTARRQSVAAHEDHGAALTYELQGCGRQQRLCRQPDTGQFCTAQQGVSKTGMVVVKQQATVSSITEALFVRS